MDAELKSRHLLDTNDFLNDCHDMKSVNELKNIFFLGRDNGLEAADWQEVTDSLRDCKELNELSDFEWSKLILEPGVQVSISLSNFWH